MTADKIFREKSSGELELLGHFEELYQSEKDPWHQLGGDSSMASYYLTSRAALIKLLEDHKVIGPGMEIGSGLGAVTKLLQETLKTKMLGVDISPTAVERASALHPDMEFICGDIMHRQARRHSDDQPLFGFVLFQQILWYILHDMDNAVMNALTWLRPYGFLIVQQAFLKKPQRYGREIADGFPGAWDLFRRRYGDQLELQALHYAVHEEHEHYDGLLMFKKKGDGAC